MKSFLVYLASRGAGLGPWTEMRSVEHSRPSSSPMLVPGRREAEPMAVPFEPDVPSPGDGEVAGEAEDRPQVRMSANPVVNTAKPTPAVRSRTTIEDPPGMPGPREVSRPGHEALEMDSVQITASAVRPAVRDDPSAEVYTDFGPLAIDPQRTARGPKPDVVGAATESPAPDIADRGESRPLTSLRATVEPAIVFAQTRSKLAKDSRNAAVLSGVKITSARPSGEPENMSSPKGASEPSTRARSPRPKGRGVRNLGVYHHDSSSRPETGADHRGRIAEHRLTEFAIKSTPRVRPGADPSMVPIAAAVKEPPAARSAEGHRGPAPEPTVTVRIGRVEVRAVQAPVKTPPPPSPGAAPPHSGFDEYQSLRNYEYWEP